MTKKTDYVFRSTEPEVTIYHEGPAGTFPTIDDLIELEKGATTVRSKNIKVIYDDGAGVKRIYYVTSKGNLGYIALT